VVGDGRFAQNFKKIKSENYQKNKKHESD